MTFSTPFRRLSMAATLAGAALSLSCPAASATQDSSTDANNAATPITAAQFFANPAFRAPKLSPGGTHVAILAGGADQRQRLAVVDLRDRSVKIVAQFADFDIGQYRWVSNERLAYTAADIRAAQGDQEYAPGLYAVNRDGSGYRQLAQRLRTFVVNPTDAKLLPWHTFLLDQDGAQDSEQLFVASRLFKPGGGGYEGELLRINTVNGRASDIAVPAGSQDWLLDAQGQPRLAITSAGDKSVLQYLDPASGAWRAIASFNPYTGAGAMRPLAFGTDGTLYVATHAGQDLASIHSFDVATGQLNPKPLLKVDGYDFHGRMIFAGGKLLGVRYHADSAETAWLDPSWQAIQQAIDAKLPNTVNLVTPPPHAQAPWVLVTAYSDRQPESYFVYNTDTKALNRIGDSHADIPAQRMGTQAALRYKARDGRDIPALLTLPAGQNKNLPLVVLVHGGPWLRGSEWRWDAESQFLASRGYAVLQPEFRGSLGFGSRHFRAGWGQWGLAMQDDLADAVQWAAAKGIADPKRVCIMGASYGGYATLMGLAKHPDVYRCGVEWAGVTDINLLFSPHWRFTSDVPAEARKFGYGALVGDPAKLADQFKATSPVNQAARITQPLLLAYGGADQRVPIVHGTTFRDAVKAHNKQVEWVEYEKEGHGWYLPETRIDFWTRVEKFLDKHIGAGAPVATQPQALAQPQAQQ